MKRYVIERAIPDVGGLTPDQRATTAARSNDFLSKLGGTANGSNPA
jgi:hypothetical protein